jgi:SAM-dependent methyltransferase
MSTDTSTDSQTQQLGRVRAVFDAWADAGRAEGMERGHAPTARPAFERLVEGTPDSLRYLDLGCGNGYSVRWAAERSPAGEAWGIDLSPAMIERARAQSSAHPNARFEVAAFPDHGLAELRPASFDAIFTMEVLYYLPDLDAALAELARLLRPGGRVASIIDFYAENRASHEWPEQLGVAMTLLDAAGWAAAFQRAGLEVIASERLRHRPDPEAAAAGRPQTWQVEQGSLLTLAVRR